jgi:hypothetical protein
MYVLIMFEVDEHGGRIAVRECEPELPTITIWWLDSLSLGLGLPSLDSTAS